MSDSQIMETTVFRNAALSALTCSKSNRNTGAVCEMCSELTIFDILFSIFTVNVEYVNACWDATIR